MKIVWIYIVSLVFLFLPARAQQKANEIKIKLAQSYERSNDYDNAIKLYLEAYTLDSNNVAVFESLKRVYLLTKKYPEAITLVSGKLKSHPDDITQLSQLGALYSRNNEDAKAQETWERALSLDSSNEVVYAIVAGAMLDVRLYEKAIDVYTRGRVACKNPNLFVSDLAYLYSNTLKYNEATQEYLKLVRDNPAQLGFIQSRMSSFTGKKDGRDSATKAVERLAKSDPDNLTYSQLLAWLYMEGKNFDLAFDVYKRIDTKTNAGGRELFNFAERSFREKAYTTSSKAYLEIINNYPKFNLMQMTKFGYARTLEESSAGAGGNDSLRLFDGANPFVQVDKPATESEPQFSGAVSAYKQIVKEFPRTEVAAKSLYRIAFLMEERFFNLDEAEETLNDLMTNYTQFIPIIADAKILLGNVFIAKGELDKAEETLQSLDKLRPVTTENKDVAGLRLAEITYYRGNFKAALEKLKSLITNVSSDITNDALTLQIFIMENQEKNSAALGEFAKAALLKRQRKLSEALLVYQDVLQASKESEIADETLMNIGDVQAQMRKFEDAVATYEKLLSDFPESIVLDRASMKLGQIYEMGLKDKAKAIDAYQQLLEKFPDSIYVSEARKRIRELRGDTI